VLNVRKTRKPNGSPFSGIANGLFADARLRYVGYIEYFSSIGWIT